ncbi:hypothetical protein JCM8547_005271 [Rhodosporidiobolus lusitaniae]
MWIFVSPDPFNTPPMPDRVETFKALSPFLRKYIALLSLLRRPNVSEEVLEEMARRTLAVLTQSTAPEGLKGTIASHVKQRTYGKGGSYVSA